MMRIADMTVPLCGVHRRVAVRQCLYSAVRHCRRAAATAAAAAAVHDGSSNASETCAHNNDSSNMSNVNDNYTTTTTAAAAGAARAATHTPLSTPPPFVFRARWRYALPFRATALHDYLTYSEDSGTCHAMAHTFYSAHDDITVTLIPIRHFAHPRFFAQVDLLCAQHMSVLMEGRAPLLSSPWSTLVPAREMPSRVGTRVRYRDSGGNNDSSSSRNDKDAEDDEAVTRERTAAAATNVSSDSCSHSDGDDATTAQPQQPPSSSSLSSSPATAAALTTGAVASEVTSRNNASASALAHNDSNNNNNHHLVMCNDDAMDPLDTLRDNVYDAHDADDEEGWEPSEHRGFLQPPSWGVRNSPQHTVVHAADAYDAMASPSRAERRLSASLWWWWWPVVRNNAPLLGSLRRERGCVSMLRPLRARGYRSFAIPWGAAHMPVFRDMLCDNGYVLVGRTALVLCHRVDGTISEGEYRKLRRRLRWGPVLPSVVSLLLLALLVAVYVLTMSELLSMLQS